MGKKNLDMSELLRFLKYPRFIAREDIRRYRKVPPECRLEWLDAMNRLVFAAPFRDTKRWKKFRRIGA